MPLVDESCGIRSNGVFGSSNGISLSVQLKDQFSCGNDYAPKMRKPYTISKQRERWTEEEHTKFLEALKLYGRAWRKIEEHVGSKTAVQIRSHAQKFFYKVARDPSGGGNANPEDPIEIPPPRPKRKPMHPYPRKIIVQSTNKENSTRSPSPDLSLSDEENCSPDSVLCLNPSAEAAGSPKSVLSLMGSETGGSTGSSPESSGSGNRDEILLERSESNTFSDAASVSIPIAESPVKLELFSLDNENSKESSTEESPSRFLKLFGRSYLISDPNRSSDKKEEKVEIVIPQQWPFYGGLHFPTGDFNSRNLGAQGTPFLERKEKSPEPPVFKWKPSSRSAFSQLRIRTEKISRGFVPYKRIAMAEEVNQSEENRTHLCL